ncbi:MAG TPA: carbonic anhydrase family protein [Telluria sp.]|nr:carbonic anhydrase family protein [Telluria sp.]
MRNLIALIACSFVTLTASANDPVPAVAKPATATAKPAPLAVKPSIVPPISPAIQRAKTEQAEIELSERIATRLAELRAQQAARITAAARVRKAQESRRRQVAIVAATAAVVAPARGTHWSYEGVGAPANWSRINDDWASCATGKRQSPIDIRDGMKVDLENITFDYHPSSFSEVDNGHTVQVTVGTGNFITVSNQTYELQQFHFHRPSEERINGKGTEMVMHLVHKSAEGKLAIVAVLLERGQPHNLIQTIWNNLPLEKHQSVAPSIVIDLKEALPQRREYYTYMGSMTTPPCSEGVLWLVMKQTMQASPAQMALFSRLYPLNARPIQPSNGRMVKESN